MLKYGCKSFVAVVVINVLPGIPILDNIQSRPVWVLNCCLYHDKIIAEIEIGLIGQVGV
jgi:hypothetical protein